MADNTLTFSFYSCSPARESLVAFLRTKALLIDFAHSLPLQIQNGIPYA